MTKKNSNKSNGVATGTVEVTQERNGVPVGPSTVTEHSAEVLFEGTVPVVINYRRGETINTGEFNSTRIDVGLQVPCSMDERDAVWKLAYDWVQARLTEEVAKVPKVASKKAISIEQFPF